MPSLVFSCCGPVVGSRFFYYATHIHTHIKSRVLWCVERTDVGVGTDKPHNPTCMLK